MLSTPQRLATLTVALTVCTSTALAGLITVGPGQGKTYKLFIQKKNPTPKGHS